MKELTPRTMELLEILDEEFQEVGIIISKIRRFGVDSYHPEDPLKITNDVKLLRELGDVIGMLDMLYKTELNSEYGMTEGVLKRLGEMKQVKVQKIFAKSVK